MSSDAPNFDYVALAPGDVDDAAKRIPRVDISAFANAHALDFRGQELPTAFVSVLPRWKEHIHSQCKGTFPDGRFGAVMYRLYEFETSEGSVRGGGEFWGTRITTTRSIKSMAGLGTDETQGPWIGNRAFAPVTTVVLRVTEAAVLAPFIIKSRSYQPLIGGNSLKDHGASHLKMSGTRWIDDEQFERLATAIAPAIAGLTDPFAEIKYGFGSLAITVNGYRYDPADLERLMTAAMGVAAGLATLAAPSLQPTDLATFDTFWGGVDTSIHAPGFWINTPEFDDGFQRAAQALGMWQEDPFRFHQRLPRCPIPGTASGVVLGTLPEGPDGATTTVRLSWHVQGGFTSGWLRTAACFPAPINTPPGPVGGVLDQATDMFVELVDGLIFIWARLRIAGRLDTVPLRQHAIDFRDRYVSHYAGR